ncbi:MAG: UbiA family prenyltransferase [Sediminibacterium sp.]|nr:UbiA family prenyltransferase [Sediminibacterium sp.]TXT29395.1 MAG: 1 4-dihydroxy-2-naphthoate octaprenyltransferase [Chitinophagaceae bacterium]
MQKSTIQLLRFHFSLFLMPIYWFALSQVPAINWLNAIIVFIVLHLLVYPASNGYNSYMDRDETAIGGLEKPMQPTRQLFFVTVVLDAVAVLLSLKVSIYFSIGVLLYILVSRAYSYRGIRLKQYPIIGFLTVVIFQGGVTFWLVYHGCSNELTIYVPWPAIIAASLLIGGFYPLTQIYQHEADKADGVTTFSYLLGYRGTFIFTAIIYALSFGVLAYWFLSTSQLTGFVLLQLFFIPTLLYFFYWANKVWKNAAAANFKHTMQMNLIASLCTNLAFITILILNLFE